MFRSSSPFSLTDLDMWDTKSRFTAQTSAWCGMETVTGTGFLSNISTSTSGSSGGFRQNDPGLRKWQSLSHLAPDCATQHFPSSPGAELRAARGGSSFRQAEGVQWLQDAHERLDTHLDRLRTRNAQLSYNMTSAQLFDMKHKLSETMGALERQKEAAELSQFEKSQQRAELHEKVIQLEKDMQQMRSSLDRGSNDQPSERTPGSLSRTLPLSQEELNGQDRQKVDTELCELREALKDAETRAKTCEEERNQAIQKCQTTTETQKTLLNQIEEMNQRLRLTRENHSEVQEQLREANNKISQACLEKAILSTQVLKLEDNAKELKAKLTSALSDKNHLIQQKADLHQRAQQGSDGCDVPVIQADTKSHNNKQAELIKEEVKALREVNEKLTGELQMIQEKLKTSQSQLQEVTAERATDSKQITDLQAERSQLIRDKEELLRRMNEAGNEQLIETKEKCCKLRESVEVLELEKQKLQDRCLCLEAEVLEKEEKLQLREEEHLKQDSTRVQRIEELKAVASHWAEKWEKVALTLHLTKEELEGLKKSNSRNETESGSLLRVELDACKQELELERSRGQALLHRLKVKGGKTLVHTEDTETQTDLSESSLLWEPPSDAHSSQNKAPQVCIQSSEVQRLKQKLSLREKELREKEEALTSLERLRETENTLAQLKIAALELKVKDEKPSAEGRKDKTVCPVLLETEQQRRMVTEQLKSLFKGREGKDIGKADSRSAAGQTGASSLQDWSQTSKAVRGAVDRRSWQQHSSGLMPVFEEDEEGVDLPGEEEGGSAEEAHTEGNVHNQSQQMSTMRAEVCNLKAKNENLLQATLRCKQPTQDKSHHCSDEVDLPLTRPLSLYPDGIFLAEFVDICSPDEDEEEGEDE